MTGEVFDVTELATPIGPVGVAVTHVGVLAVVFGPGEKAEALAGGLDGVRRGRLAGHVARVGVEFAQYFAGSRRAFDLPVDWRLSHGYAQRVLRELLATVPYGQTTSYGALARRVAAKAAEPAEDGDAVATTGGATAGGAEVDAPVDPHQAARAVGRAMATNPVPIVVPCHRVVASDGALHGFGGGLETKRRLLALEGALPMTLDDTLAFTAVER